MRSLHAAVLALFAAAAGQAQPAFSLHDGDRVVFYGDSITDQRLYTTFAESYVVTRFPALNIAFTHSGWGGDRVTGGGGGPIDVRLARDVFPYRPSVMTIMLGMNDGNYKPFDEAAFTIYRNGMEHILDSVSKNAPDCRITLIQPSPYDDVTRQPLFEGGYNAVLLRFSDYLAGLAQARHLGLADLNTPVAAMLRKAFAADPAQAAKILPDRVHPAAAGHIVMAEALLKAWHAPALVSDVAIDAQAGSARTENAKVSDLKTGPQISWTETEGALPMPIDPRDKLLAFTLQSSDFVEALDREAFRVTGLTGPAYELKIDGVAIGRFSGEELAKGINLATLNTPMLRQALDVHALTLKHNNIHFARWRTVETGLANDGSPATKMDAEAALDRLDNELAAEQRAAAQPRPHHYELTPAQ
ncbi:MAG: SGNH/GDSL hydrolase family protein [Acidobacteriota bacterium]|nr:SGNH/GDSL hydrolase family protein [Acidobacteriota bacterium]